jgi:putative transposase
MAHGRRYVVTHIVDFSTIMARDEGTGLIERVQIADIKLAAGDIDESAAPDLAALDARDWDEARRRQKVIQSLLDNPRRPRADVERAGETLGVDPATVYRWMRAYRDHGRLSALLPTTSGGGRGKTRLSEDLERIVEIGINEFYLTRQQRSVTAAFAEIRRLCRAQGIPPPHENTVRARIRAISEKTRLKKRGHGKAASDRFDARPGTFDEAKHPLAVVQLDHTKLDIALVDSQERLPIGRPWITLAFDVFSRMVVGFYISLDPPSAHTTGLAIAHAVLPKETWLATRGIAHEWPVWGFPACIHLDNAKEFHGEMLRRACEEHQVRIDFRPVARPHFGGHIERMMGTLATELHKLPGAALAPKKRGDYDPDAEATMTLEELEVYVAEFITRVYHARVHKGISEAPIARWKRACLGDERRPGVGMPARPADPERIQLDFSPYVERTIQTYGVKIDDISYYSDVLRPYIGATEGKRKRSFIFRRDPRDISRVHFFDPNLRQYSEIPYRDISKPAMTAWELREIRRRLIDEGKRAVDEQAIFVALESLRQKSESAKAATKRVRRERERRPKPAVRSVVAPQQFASVPVVTPRHKIVPFEIEDV